MRLIQDSARDGPRSVPFFRDHGTVYPADACRPLVSAVEAGQIKFRALARGHYPGGRLAPHALLGLKSLAYWDADVDQEWGLPWHRNEGIEICFLETGALDFGVDNCKYVLQPDCLTITHPWQLHSIGNPYMGPNRLHWLILDVGIRRPNQPWKWPRWILLKPSEAEELSGRLRHNSEAPVWHCSANIRHCFESLARCVDQDHAGDQTSRIAVRVNDLLLMLLDLLRSQNNLLNSSVSGSRHAVQSFLEDFTAHPDQLIVEWTVDKMARACGLNTTQFAHYVKQLKNVAPMHYLNRRRLEFAARLLTQNGAMSITQVAFASGFSSSQYFATLFKRRFKMSPKEFRCSHVQKSSNGG